MRNNRRRSPRITDDVAARWIRGRRVITARARDCSLHGLFLVTSEWIASNQAMDVRMELPGGELSMMVTSRYVGPTRYGEGIGVSILLASPEDLRRWVAHYGDRVQQATQLRRVA